MSGFILHPFETSMCLWALMLSLLICLIMGLMKKVLLRNCILFFFWFMTNAVFEVLEITALGREDVFVYRTLIQTVYIINTAVICVGLAGGIRHGLKNILNFTKEEWLYIGINALAVFAGTGALITLGVSGRENFGSLPVILWLAAGIGAAVLAAALDLTVFARLHRRLRRNSPHMLYVFAAAVFPACFLIPPVFGLSAAGPLFTLMMILFLALYMLGVLYRKRAGAGAADVQEASDTIRSDHSETRSEQEEKVRIIKEYVHTDDASLLAQNPHFICNTLNNIVYQIDHSSDTAKKSLSDLADYMQGKYSSVRKDHMIPFESEIRIVNCYLSLQKARFEDQLNTVTDYRTTGFQLPPLSLLTVVEHALSNILLHRPEGGTLRLETARNGDDIEIRILCDDDINDEESLRHIGDAFPLLKTVSERLDYFCGGSLNAAREDGKTVFTLRVPVRPEEEEESAGASPASPDAV